MPLVYHNEIQYAHALTDLKMVTLAILRNRRGCYARPHCFEHGWPRMCRADPSAEYPPPQLQLGMALLFCTWCLVSSHGSKRTLPALGIWPPRERGDYIMKVERGANLLKIIHRMHVS